MGTILVLTTVADENIERMLETPALIWSLVAPDEPDWVAQALSSTPKPGFFARLLGRTQQTNPRPDIPALTFAAGERNETDLDKAWHGIHFLLTGSAWKGDPPLNFLVAGGTQVGDVDVGYGPARAFRASEVALIAAALESVSQEDLRGRFDPGVMMREGIYPEIWNRPQEEDDTLGYVLEYDAVLRHFIRDAVDRGLGMVVTLT